MEATAREPAGAVFAEESMLRSLLRVGDKIVAALGVGGAPGGNKDEACTRAGVAEIRDRVAAAAQTRSG
jgi:hypothetical protein